MPSGGLMPCIVGKSLICHSRHCSAMTAPGADHVKRIAAARNVRAEPAADADRSPMELRVGARLRHARLLNRMRLKDVAERAKCSEGLLSQIENDRAVPSLTTLHRLCKALNLSVSALLNKDFAQPWSVLP